MIKLFIFLLLMTFMSCGTKSGNKKKSNPPGLSQNLSLGESTTTEVTNELGEPATTYTVEDAEMYQYKDNKTYKFDNNVVKAFFRDPMKDEIHLQYWLQKWKDQNLKEEIINDSKNPHGQYDYQMTSQLDLTTIIYNKENGIVKRVMYYEK